VIFANGQIQPDEDLARFRVLGLALKSPRQTAGAKFNQPCPAFESCRCGIYEDRPRYCREFECLLLKGVIAGKVTFPDAQRTVRSARRRAEKVKRLLRLLGDNEEQVALSVRIRRAHKRFQTESYDVETSIRYGELTLAAHKLQLLLSQSFYPG
jgi:Fe-S-cluster containining protein